MATAFGSGAGGISETVPGVVEAHPREPPGAGHVPGAQHGGEWGGGVDVEEFPDRRPESLEVGNRPAVQIAVGLKAQAALIIQPAQEPADFAAVDDLRAGNPHRRRHGGHDGLTFPARPSRNAVIRAFASVLLPATAAIKDSSK
jgi:hypothetical protein